ncbi:MAG: hypothetical protein L0215_07410 [Gemmataceae bacterium]|nr:hypothetical protein [Gemmataceae bacterium]
MSLRPFREQPGGWAVAFRGYNIANLGRTPELLQHRAYGPTVAAVLGEATQVCSEALGRRVNLVDRVLHRRETVDLSTYAEDIALVVAAELAQLRLLRDFHGVSIQNAKLVFGYSLGEIAALIATGVYRMRDLLPVPLAFAQDSVALAQDASLGVLFSRGREIDQAAVERLCQRLSHEGRGVIAVSTHLSPNSLLLLGQQDTIDRFRARMHEQLAPETHLHKHSKRWPPLHTPIMWQRHVPDRAGVMLHTTPGGFTAPTTPILSGVTGRASYLDYNSRWHLYQWVDHPQRLWDVVQQTLSAGVHTVVHVGPAPNIIPATFKRLSDNVRAQTTGFSPGNLGRRVVSHMARRPWLTRLLPADATLLRAPFVEHLMLEDWLLEHELRPVAGS